MKAILLSVRPKWVEKISNGEKTIEVQKTAPKEVPFKAYIYCTKKQKMAAPLLWHSKIVGEFVCDYIQEITTETVSPEGVSCFFKDFYNIKKDDLKKIGLNHEELWNYGQGKPLYGWHISDLKIYGKPKGLASFIFLVISQVAKIVKNHFFMIVGAKKDE
nr:MAG TPA: helix-turn-helix domain-containing protein [Caudoviricetes sp.]